MLRKQRRRRLLDRFLICGLVLALRILLRAVLRGCRTSRKDEKRKNRNSQDAQRFVTKVFVGRRFYYSVLAHRLLYASLRPLFDKDAFISADLADETGVSMPILLV